LKQTTNLNGLILAGGKSRRMGHDKCQIQFTNGKPQFQVLQSLLIKYCDNVFLSRRRDQVNPAIVKRIVDQYDMEGPLNGLLSAFKYDPLMDWISVPCDMPMIDDGLLSYLLSNRNRNKVATCFWDSDKKFPEPLLTIWEKKAGKLLTEFYNSGGMSPRKFLMQNDVEIIEAPDSKKLLNVNTPEELSKISSKSF
jgi:molybdopterin-guanine dinucleotide biosynthesis protein A